MSLLSQLLHLLDEKNEVKKRIYKLEHCEFDSADNLWLVNAIENEMFKLQVLKQKLENLVQTENVSSGSI